jgi:serine/threonine-protein kinase
MERPTELTSAQTISVPAAPPASPKHLSQTSSAHSHFADEGRFLPGTLLAGRYRIVGMLGKGGMGEVYRATDLTLGQSVALKFLPASAAENNFLLERFHGEVRVARQISHPNVCRVYDIGETEGMPFISMEYVDGEDLASLLPRIGRLPADRAVSTARKICAGLAAAHAKGVIHRDLKPHNIMLDKRGEIVIMDFGLAAIADQLSGPEARNGTPAYMAPEQLKGTEVTARSDIYALGLVLYEIFTGRKPYDAKSIKDLITQQESAQLTSMTSIAADIDPAVEHVIRRCLDPDPSKRPADALLVSAALPGGDPLAAALAAGETPSPELVAASGKTEGMAMKYAWLCLAFVVATLIATPLLKQQKQAFMQTPLDYSSDVLKQKSRDFTVSFGHTAHPVDSDFGLDQRRSLLTYLDRLPAPRDFKAWLASEAPAIGTYREAQDPIIAEPLGTITENNPPLVTPGSIEVLIEAGGRLRGFEAIPPDPAAAIAPIPFEAVFQAAGFDPSRFTEVSPRTLPTVPTDTLRAWKGFHPVIPGINPQIDIGWWKGRVTWVKLTWPWTMTGGARKTNPFFADLQALIIPALVSVGLFFAILFARRNWKQDRADRRGAFVVGITMFSLNLVGWVAAVHIAPSSAMAGISANGLADSITAGAVYLVLYLALEPALRLRWPHAIITWNRVLAGRWKDPQVGSHIMIGLALGVLLAAFGMVQDLFTIKSEGLDTLGGIYLLNGTRFWIAGTLDRAQSAISSGIEIFFTLFGLRQLLRRDWLAAVAGGVLFSLLQSDLQNSVNWQAQLLVLLVILTGLTFALVRFGLVVCITAVFALNTIESITLGSDWSTWYAPTGFATILLVLAITTLAFRTTLGDRELL